MRQRALKSWAFITACNPRSEPLAPEENHLRQADLRDYLLSLGYSIFPGRGIAEEPGWPPEKSFLILGISREAAVRLGTMLEQIAIVAGEHGAVADLVCCPLPEKPS